MSTIKFAVRGIPTAKGRARVTRGGIAYTPAKTKQAEQSFLAQAVRYAPAEPLAGPLALELLFVFPIPKSYSKKRACKCRRGRELPAKKPDLDNLEKLVMDAMNGVFYCDDAQVVCKESTKVYGDVPGVVVALSPCDENNLHISQVVLAVWLGKKEL